MAAGTKSVLHPTGLVHGHSECRYLDESIPVLTQVLALDLVQRRDHEAVLKHPNTGWKLILHEGGAEVKDKPERNHYGVRVSNNEEVDRAYQYLLANKEKLGLKKVVKRKERAGSYSMFLVEPGGNYWEIESYENRHKAGLPEPIAYPWKTKLTEERLPGCGYIPQAMTHGTLECVDLDASVKFYKEGLGLDVVTHVPTVKPHDIKAQRFGVKLHRRCQIGAFHRAVGHRLRNITAARKFFFGELVFPWVGNMFRQARFMPVLVGLDLPVIAARLDEKHRIGAVALPALDDFL